MKSSTSITKNLYQHDLALFNNPEVEYIIGLDEVGRGALAGQVSVGGVLLKKSALAGLKQAIYDGSKLIDLNDSKKLKMPTRELIVSELEELAASSVLSSIVKSRSALQVDKYGILVCIFKLMKEIISYFIKTHKLEPGKLLVLVDGRQLIPQLKKIIKQKAIIKGDTQSLVIASAANLAKVSRDQKMQSLAKKKKYANYLWESNMGYGSLKHRQAVLKDGLSDLHRKSFCRNLS
jgi:ribonuclease HII